MSESIDQRFKSHKLLKKKKKDSKVIKLGGFGGCEIEICCENVCFHVDVRQQTFTSLSPSLSVFWSWLGFHMPFNFSLLRKP